jgi:hypothetical protein
MTTTKPGGRLPSDIAPAARSAFIATVVLAFVTLAGFIAFTADVSIQMGVSPAIVIFGPLPGNPMIDWLYFFTPWVLFQAAVAWAYSRHGAGLRIAATVASAALVTFGLLLIAGFVYSLLSWVVTGTTRDLGDLAGEILIGVPVVVVIGGLNARAVFLSVKNLRTHDQMGLAQPPNSLEQLELRPSSNRRQTTLPMGHSIEPAYISSLIVAGLIAAVSCVGLIFGTTTFYSGDPRSVLGVTTSAAGVLLPGFLAHDAFNLAVAFPLLLGSMWLTTRGSLMGLLLWPGVLFYALYTYTTYLIGAPFSLLFIAYVAIFAVATYTIIGLVTCIDPAAVHARLARAVPGRSIAVVLVALGVLTFAQDGFGAVTAAFSGTAGPIPRQIWIADLALEVPAIVLGGILLWRRHPLGYVVAPGLLLQFGMTPAVLAAIMALQPVLTGLPVDTPTIAGLLVFSLVSFVPIGFFVRASVSQLSPVTRSEIAA